MDARPHTSDALDMIAELKSERDEARAERDELRAALVKWLYADDGYNGNREDRSLRELIPADDWGIKP